MDYIKEIERINTDITEKTPKDPKSLKPLVEQGLELLTKNKDLMNDKPNKIAFIKSLRKASLGKIIVELERVTLSKMLAAIYENDGNLADACDVLYEVRVESVGSMKPAEKCDFILEQFRHALAIGSYSRAEISKRKVDKGFLEDEEFQDLKLKYWDLVIQYNKHEADELEIAKAYEKIRHTPKVEEDQKEYQEVLRSSVLHAVLAPYSPESVTLLNFLHNDHAVADMPFEKMVLDKLSSSEFVSWPLENEDTWKKHPDMDTQSYPVNESEDEKDRWGVFRKRVVHHNVRVAALYYSSISLNRLANLIGISTSQLERYLAEAIIHKMVWARIDRPAGTIQFSRDESSNEVIQNWGNDIKSILDKIDTVGSLL